MAKIWWRIRGFLFLFAITVSLAGCDQNEPVHKVNFSNKGTPAPDSLQQQTSYIFGFDQRSSLQEDARQYQSLLQFLEQETGYKFQLVLNSGESRLDEKLGSGEIHFAAIGAVTHITGNEKFGLVPIVRGLNSDNKAEYQSAIVVNPTSSLQSISELTGKRFAFGNLSSTQGHLIPRIALLNAGIGLSDLATYSYTGSHRDCANAVISGKFDACGMQDTMAREMQKSGLVKIIFLSQSYPSSGISASTAVPDEAREKVRLALLSLSDKGISNLYNWHKTEMPNGFIKAFEKDYSSLRSAMESLNMLPIPEQAKQ